MVRSLLLWSLPASVRPVERLTALHRNYLPMTAMRKEMNESADNIPMRIYLKDPLS